MPALPPGPRLPPPLQLAGWWARMQPWMLKLRARFGTRFSVRLPGAPPFVILSDPAAIKDMLTAPADVLHPGEGAQVLEPILGSHSVILLDEAPHMEQRKLMLPAFHGDRMQRLTGLMEDLTARELDSWPSGEPLATHARLQSLTLEIILQAVFGLDEGPQLARLRDQLARVLDFAESPVSLLPPLQRLLDGRGKVGEFQRAKARVDAEIYPLIAARREEGGQRDDVLAMLLAATHEDGSPMSDVEIRDELMTALLAGHETTASSLAFAFEQLARRPDAWARLADGDPAFLEATINEVLRRRPVLVNPEPRLVVKPVTVGGHEYEPGVVLVASAYLVHHDPAIYPDPFAFRPERFLERKPGTYSFLAFGGGRRRCLGASFALLEMRVVLRAAAARFELAADGPPQLPRRRGIAHTPSEGGRVTVTARVREPALVAA